MNQRRFPISRKVLSILPKWVRFPLMRRQLNLRSTLDSRFSFRIARTQEELSAAYKILHDSYLEMGYAKYHESGMRIVKYFALPSTTTLIAVFDEKVVGTISIVRRSSLGVPMESAFDLSNFIKRNEVIAEVSSLAVDKHFRQKRGALFLPLLKFFWEYVEGYMNLDSIVIVVNPKMSDFYEGFLGFRQIKHATTSDYSFANGHPGIGLYLNVKTARQVFASMYEHLAAEKNLYRYFVDLHLPHFNLPHREFYKSADPVMSPEMLKYFFKIKSNVFAELTPQEQMGIAALYPEERYREVLPILKSVPSHRKETRHSVNLKCTVNSQDDLKFTVHNISMKGLSIVSPIHLRGIIYLKIEVGPNRIAEVRGEVRHWDNERQVYGVRLLKTDSNLEAFIKYMMQDFDYLLETETQKAS